MTNLSYTLTYMKGEILFYNTLSCFWHIMALYFLRMMTVVMVTNTVSMWTVGDLIICACAVSSSGIRKHRNRDKCYLK